MLPAETKKYDQQTFQFRWQDGMLHLLFNLTTSDVKSWLLSRRLIIIVSERLASTAYQLGWQSIKMAKLLTMTH